MVSVFFFGTTIAIEDAPYGTISTCEARSGV